MQAFGDGFGLYAAVGDAFSGYWDSGSTSGVSLITGRFTGTQALQVSSAGTIALTKSSGANDAVHHIVCAFRQTATLTGTTLGGYFQLVDGTTNQCAVVFRSDGAMLLASGGPTGTVLDTYTGAVTAANTWFAFEIEVVVNNTTGSWSIRKNGNTSNDHTLGSLNTRGGTTNNYANKFSLGTSGAFTHQFADVLWRSDPTSVAFVGDIRCYTRMPASDASKQWTPNSGTTNYTQVDEIHQDGTTSYVYDSTSGQGDFYTIGTLAADPASVVCVTTRGFFEKSDAGTRGAAVQLKSGATTVTSTATLLSTSFGWLWRTDLTDPNTSAAWTAAHVDSVQIGPTVTS